MARPAVPDRLQAAPRLRWIESAWRFPSRRDGGMAGRRDGGTPDGVARRCLTGRTPPVPSSSAVCADALRPVRPDSPQRGRGGPHLESVAAASSHGGT